MIDLIPQPKRFRKTKSSFSLLGDVSILLNDRELLLAAQGLASDIESITSMRPAIRVGEAALSDLVIELKTGVEVGSGHDAYEVKVLNQKIIISGETLANVFYGVQTLRQLISIQGSVLTGCTIKDSSDFEVRGFYHDITRGMVPTLEDLYSLVDTLAHYKINQLQLYVEHTFAFAKHVDIWGGNDPLSAEEILALDEYCAKRHIDLVPSLTSFGHFYMGLRSPRKEHLNEIDIEAGKQEYSFYNRMAHYTLDPSQAESLSLVKEIIEEYAPLFRSKYFNICCDETFDLGKGKNKERVDKSKPGAVYLEFLFKVMEVTRNCGKTPQYWGDIILHDVADSLKNKLPKDAIALNWDYSSDLSFGASKPFHDLKVPFYVCPGVCGWDQWIADTETANQNITKLAKQGQKYKAQGLLNTNWGDRGHLNTIGTVTYGMLLGAAVSWNVKSGNDLLAFDNAFNQLHMKDDKKLTAKAIQLAGNKDKVTWRLISNWLDSSQTMIKNEGEKCPKTNVFLRDLNALSRKTLVASSKKLDQATELLMAAKQGAKPKDGLLYDEMLVGCEGARLNNSIALFWLEKSGKSKSKDKINAYELSDSIRKFEHRFRAVWHKRNRPSDFWRVSQKLLDLAEQIDRLK